MSKLTSLFIEDQNILHYAVDTHMTVPEKQNVLNKLTDVFPNTKIIVTFADDTLLTYNPPTRL